MPPEDPKKKNYLNWKLDSVLGQASRAASSPQQPPRPAQPAPAKPGAPPEADTRPWWQRGIDWVVDQADPEGAEGRAEARKQASRYRVPSKGQP